MDPFHLSIVVVIVNQTLLDLQPYNGAVLELEMIVRTEIPDLEAEIVDIVLIVGKVGNIWVINGHDSSDGTFYMVSY